MTRLRVDLIGVGGHTSAYVPRLWRQNTAWSWQFKYSHICPIVVRAYICISMCPSAHFKQLLEQKLQKTGRECWENTPTSQGMMEAADGDVTLNSGFAGYISQSASIHDIHVFRSYCSILYWEQPEVILLPHDHTIRCTCIFLESKGQVTQAMSCL